MRLRTRQGFRHRVSLNSLRFYVRSEGRPIPRDRDADSDSDSLRYPDLNKIPRPDNRDQDYLVKKMFS